MTGEQNEQGGHLRIERVFDAPVDEVYRAWTAPEKLEKWAWGTLGKDVTAEVELRSGGRYRIETSRQDGSRLAFSGTYREVVPQEKLVYTVTWEEPMGYESPGEKVTVEFHPKDARTQVVFVHEGVPEGPAQQEHVRGWQNTFDLLDRLLKAGG